MTARRRAIPPLLAGLLLAAAPAPGCAKAREGWRARLNPAEAEPARMIETSAENLSPAEEGLEIIVWTSNDPDHRVARALRAYAAGTPPVPPEDAAVWARVGLRLLEVPADDLESLLAACPPVSPLQRQRFGQIPVWTPLVRGPQTPDGLPGPDGRALPGGRPRLIARSWVEPQIAGDQRRDVVRTELGVQVEQGRRQSLLADPGLERSIADEGPILHALLTTHTGRGRVAMVLVAEQPGLDWADLPDPLPDALPDGSGSPDPAPPTTPTPTPTPTPVAPGPVPAASVPPRPRSLGEWMLSSPAFPAAEGRPPVPARKVFVVFLPRLRSVSPAPDVVAPPADLSSTPRGER